MATRLEGAAPVHKVQESELAFLNQDEIEQLLAACAG